ncbi:hypothetical protein QR680_014276 [Steinernema hermaphroditum]|uniref:Activin types I and II receptor domain-containing protein n=1 Tax=Steinernema hermaphroditum TaxID=289476 RepID=A0AA39M3M8_9BILA|nr:hypothetical protein QR680_014276 [Steinernema hermaphroditum]
MHQASVLLVLLLSATAGALTCFSTIQSDPVFNGQMSMLNVNLGRLLLHNKTCDGNDSRCYSMRLGPLYFSGCHSDIKKGLPFMADFKIPLCDITDLPGKYANCSSTQFDNLGDAEVCCCTKDLCNKPSTTPSSTTTTGTPASTKSHSSTSPATPPATSPNEAPLLTVVPTLITSAVVATLIL